MVIIRRRQDLEDLLTDQQYFQTVFMGLPRVQSLLLSLLELGRANEAIASEYMIRSFPKPLCIIVAVNDTWILAEKNLALQDELYKLRSETQQAFDEAKALEARWKVLEREQKELHSVSHNDLFQKIRY
jgi:ESCRT-I complex subunit VPS37